jgi:hypothetical protein
MPNERSEFEIWLRSEFLEGPEFVHGLDYAQILYRERLHLPVAGHVNTNVNVLWTHRNVLTSVKIQLYRSS